MMTDRLTRYVVAVSVSGAAAVVGIALALWGRGDEVPSATRILVLLVLSLASVLMPLRFYRTGGSQGFHFEGAVLVAGLLTLNPLWVPLLMTSASVLGHAAKTRDPRKAAFNSGQVGIQTSAATLVFLWLAGMDAPASAAVTLLAAVLASLVYEAVSVLAMGELFHRLDGTPRWAAAKEVAALAVVTFAGNAAYGIVLGSVLETSVLIAVISGALMLGLYVGYRGYAAAVSDQRRAESLNEVTHLLIDMPPGEGGLATVLTRVVSVFGGTEGEMVVEMPEGIRHCHLEGGQVNFEAGNQLPRSGLLATAIARDAGIVQGGDRHEPQDVIAAPIRRSERAAGAIAVRGRRGFEPWDQSDATLLGAIANELAVALDNVSLFAQVEEERARLEAESTKLNNILGAATDGISSFLADGTIEAWNPGMARITGVSAETAIGQPWHAVLRLKDGAGVDLAPTGDHMVARALCGDFANEPLSLQVLRADGVWRLLQCTASPVREPDGDHRGVVMVARDVTTERELEELKADFISTVSHELRTPLTPLKGFLATLRNTRTALTEEQLESIHGSMSTQLIRLETLISDLLAVAELDHGQFNLYPEPLALGELVSEAVEVEAADQFSRCTVTVDPDARAVADSVALVRVVRSLVANAVKHTEGRVEVTIRAVGERVEIAVTDEGPGIASWDQQRVFNRFERLGNHLRRTQGPGLGLTIARTLAQRMGGDVSLSSDIGRGAVFTLSLPRARPHAVDSAPAEPGVERVDEAMS